MSHQDPARTGREQHPVALKVMRLYKPALHKLHASPGQFGQELRPVETMLQLPESFHKIYTGQTFSSYICIVGGSGGGSPVNILNVRMDLQTTKQKLDLTAMQRVRSPTTEGLVATQFPQACYPSRNIEMIVEQEIVVSGVHTLRVVVEYEATSRERRSFSKYYRFNVEHPFLLMKTVRTVDSNPGPNTKYSRSVIAVEITVKNITQEPFTIESFSLDPHPAFEVEDVESRMLLHNEANSEMDEVLMPCIGAGESMNYVFLMHPKPSTLNDPDMRPSDEIGNCSLCWNSGFGEKGRLSSNSIQRSVPAKPALSLSVSLDAAEVAVGDTVTMQCLVSNESTDAIDALLQCNSEELFKLYGLSVVGVCSDHLGTLNSSAVVQRTITAVARQAGLHKLDRGVGVEDLGTGNTFGPYHENPIDLYVKAAK